MTNSTQPASSWAALFQSGKILTLVMLSLGVWLHAANMSIISTLLPSAVAEMDGGSFISWAVAVYQIGAIVAGAATGWIVSRQDLRVTMSVFAIAYSLGCIGGALSTEMFWLVAARLVQGTGGGALVALVFVACNRFFPQDMVPKVIAFVSAVWGASAFMGPMVGGLFAEAGNWRGGFWAFAGQGVFLSIALLLLLPSSHSEAENKAAPPIMRLGLFAMAVISIASAGVDELRDIALPLCLLGGAILILFFRVDSKAGDNRLFPRGVMDIRGGVGAGIGMVFWSAAATMSFGVYGPILLNLLYGIGPLMTGYMIALEAVAWTTTALIFSGFVAQERLWIRLGSLSVTIGLSSLAFLVPYGESLWLLPPALFLTGGGFGLFFAFVMRRIVASVPEEEKARVSTAVPSLHMMGYALGAALSGVVASFAGFHEGDYQSTAFWVFAAFIPVLFIGNFAAWRLTRD